MLPESPEQRNWFEQGAEYGEVKGRAKGRVEGWIDGRAEGRVEGMLDGKAQMLLRLIQQRGWAITEAQQRRIVDCADVALLNRWVDRILPATSLDDLLAG